MEAEAFKNKKMLLITTETPRNAGLNSLSFFLKYLACLQQAWCACKTYDTYRNLQSVSFCKWP